MQRIEKTRKILVLYLDAFKYQYLNKEDTPFIFGLAEKGICSNLNTLPGYNLEYTIFSGAYPLKHNSWNWFYLDSKNSAFGWMRPFLPIFNLVDTSYLRSFITYFTCFQRFFLQKKTRLTKICQIPLKEAVKFNISQDRSYIDKNPLNTPTLYDILRRKKISYFALDWPVCSDNERTKIKFFGSKDKDGFAALKKKAKKAHFLFVHVWNLDTKMHKFGINHPLIKEHLKKLDSYAKDLVLYLREKGEVDVIIFTDHGMVPIVGTVNLIEILQSLQLKNGLDFTLFLGSVISNIWFNKPELKPLVKKELSHFNEFELYDERNIHKLKIPYRREFVGDLLLILKPGLQFSPNYFQKNGVVKAMHGYANQIPDLDGIFIINSARVKKKQLKDVQLVDIMPTILDLLNIKIPNYCDGRSRL